MIWKVHTLRSNHVEIYNSITCNASDHENSVDALYTSIVMYSKEKALLQSNWALCGFWNFLNKSHFERFFFVWKLAPKNIFNIKILLDGLFDVLLKSAYPNDQNSKTKAKWQTSQSRFVIFNGAFSLEYVISLHH